MTAADELEVLLAGTGDQQRGYFREVVERGAPGLAAGKRESKMGLRASPTTDVALDGVPVPAAARIGAEGEGFAILTRTLNASRPTIAAQAVGIAQGALDKARAYALERRQFGRPIAEFQGLQFLLADMVTQIEAARALAGRAAALWDEGRPSPGLSAMAKLFASDAAMRVTTDAVQVLGGNGFLKEFGVERFMRDAKITQIYEGTNQVMRLVVARQLLGHGRGERGSGGPEVSR